MSGNRCARALRPLPSYSMLFAFWMLFGSIFGFVCGWRAIPKNRSATGWFMAGLIMGPIALIALITRERREQPAFL